MTLKSFRVKCCDIEELQSKDVVIPRTGCNGLGELISVAALAYKATQKEQAKCYMCIKNCRRIRC